MTMLRRSFALAGLVAAMAITGTAGQAGECAAAAGDNVVRVQDPAAPAAPPRRRLVLNTLNDIGMALETCWEGNLPPPDQARPGMMVTVMLAFTRTGQLLGEPRFMFTTREASPETRALYQRAVVAAINTCTPLPFSDGLGGAVAGRPATFQFVERRNQKGA